MGRAVSTSCAWKSGSGADHGRYRSKVRYITSNMITCCSILFRAFLDRIAAAPSFPGLRRFPEGRNFKQWTGNDSKALMKVRLYYTSSWRLNTDINGIIGLSSCYRRIRPYRYGTLLRSVSRLLLSRKKINSYLRITHADASCIGELP